MDIHIRPMSNNDIDALVQLTLSAFEPIFSSFAEIMGPQIYPFIYPDWKTRQTDTIEKVWKSEEINAWVAELDGMVIGLVAYVLNDNDKTGQVDFLVVHPEYQNGGVGTELNNFALQKMHQAGMQMAVVGTGGDGSHAPARRSYEKAGYTALPLVRFYKKL